jgi:hypothetical protein
MFGFGKRKQIVVKDYDSDKAYERDANRLARQGYSVEHVVVSKAVGLPTLSHGILHDRLVVTYQCAGCR